MDKKRRRPRLVESIIQEFAPNGFDGEFVITPAMAKHAQTKNEAWHLVNSGDVRATLVFLEEALARYPDDQYLYRLKANSLGAIKRYKEAVEILRAVVNNSPSDVDAYVELAGIYSSATQRDKAVVTLEQALQRVALSEVQRQEIIGLIAYYRRLFAEACPILADIWSAGSEPAYFGKVLAQALWRTARRAEAEVILAELSARYPTKAEIQIAYANVLYCLRRWPDAIEAYTRVLALQPKNEVAPGRRFWAGVRGGRVREAFALVVSAVSRDDLR